MKLIIQWTWKFSQETDWLVRLKPHAILTEFLFIEK